jgi:hypothetical protein
MDPPRQHIGSIDIKEWADGAGAPLRAVRNTTLKKALSAFIAIRGMTRKAFLADGPQLLQQLCQLGVALATDDDALGTAAAPVEEPADVPEGEASADGANEPADFGATPTEATEDS